MAAQQDPRAVASAPPARRDARVPREYALLVAAGDLMIVIYTAAFLSVIGTADPHGTQATYLLLIPSLATSGLVAGAQRRFGVKARMRPGEVAVVTLVITGFVVLAFLNIAGFPYPGWVDAAFVALLALALVGVHLPVWRRSVRDARSTWRTTRLSRPARLVTSGLGVLAALLIATSPWEYASLGAVLVAIVAIATLVLSTATPYALSTVGAEWRRIHWLAGAWAVTACFAAGLTAIALGGVPWPVAAALAIVGACPLIVTPFVAIPRS